MTFVLSFATDTVRYLLEEEERRKMEKKNVKGTIIYLSLSGGPCAKIVVDVG